MNTNRSINPWKKIDLDREARFGSTDPLQSSIDRRMIDFEYANAMEPERCGFPGCNETAHYRPSVGSLMCQSGHVLSLNGDWR